MTVSETENQASMKFHCGLLLLLLLLLPWLSVFGAKWHFDPVVEVQ